MPKKPAKAGKSVKLPNARQQALLKNLSKGMTQGEAAIAAGYSGNNPAQSAHQALKQMTKTWPEELENVLGTHKTVIQKYLVPLMNATEKKVFHHNHRVIYSKPMIAWGPRANGLDMYWRIAGAYQDEKKQDAGPIQVQVITNVMLPSAAIVSANGHKPAQDD